MPNIKSAIKRVNQTVGKTARNKAERTEVANIIRKVRAAIDANDVKTAEALLPVAYKTLDQAVASGIIHKNNAANKKSALTKTVNDLKTGKLVIAAKIDSKTRIAEKKAKEAAEKEAARAAAKVAAAEKESRKAAKKVESKPVAAKATKKAEAETEAKPVAKKAPAKKVAAEEAPAKKAETEDVKPAAKKAPAKKAETADAPAEKKPAAKKAPAKKAD